MSSDDQPPTAQIELTANTLPRFLVVDDSPPFSQLVKTYLLAMGFEEVATAEDAEIALKLLSQQKFDLIISDFNMPGMDGVEFFNTIKNDPNLKDIPFLMISSEVRKESIEKISQSGIKDFLLLYLETGGMQQWIQ